MCRFVVEGNTTNVKDRSNRVMINVGLGVVQCYCKDIRLSLSLSLNKFCFLTASHVGEVIWKSRRKTLVVSCNDYIGRWHYIMSDYLPKLP